MHSDLCTVPCQLPVSAFRLVGATSRCTHISPRARTRAHALARTRAYRSKHKHTSMHAHKHTEAYTQACTHWHALARTRTLAHTCISRMTVNPIHISQVIHSHPFPVPSTDTPIWPLYCISSYQGPASMGELLQEALHSKYACPCGGSGSISNRPHEAPLHCSFAAPLPMLNILSTYSCFLACDCSLYYCRVPPWSVHMSLLRPFGSRHALLSAYPLTMQQHHTRAR